MSSASDTTAAGALPDAPAAPAHPALEAAHVPTTARRKYGRPVALGVLVAIALTWLGRELVHSYHFVETDNAYVVGHLHQVGPQVEGRVLEVLAQENQVVPAGAPLVRLDSLEYQLAIEKARATLAQVRAQAAQTDAVATQADAQLTEADARVKQAEAQRAQTGSQLDLARLTLERTQSLFARGGVVSQSDLDNARAAERAAAAALAANQANVAAAESTVGAVRAAQASAHAQVNAAAAAIAVAESALRDAQRKLSYTTLTAPAAGRVGSKSVEVGNYLLPGQVVLSVAEADPWVVANFKETQLAHMQAGQAVELSVDALPGQSLHGTVESISPASGAQFALLPPDNATGNFNKVVQRVPVKIVFDEASRLAMGDRLRLGLSVIVAVRIR